MKLEVWVSSAGPGLSPMANQMTPRKPRRHRSQRCMCHSGQGACASLQADCFTLTCCSASANSLLFLSLVFLSNILEANSTRSCRNTTITHRDLVGNLMGTHHLPHIHIRPQVIWMARKPVTVARERRASTRIQVHDRRHHHQQE